MRKWAVLFMILMDWLWGIKFDALAWGRLARNLNVVLLKVNWAFLFPRLIVA